MWSIVVVALVFVFLFKFSRYLRTVIWISRQLPGPKYTFPTGNIAELKKYDHVCEAFTDWSAKYGTTFRVWLGPFQCVVVSTDPNHLKQMMVADKDRWDVGDRAALRRFTGESLLTSRNPVWQHQRSLMNPAFHFQNLRELTPIFDQYVKPFLQVCETAATTGEPLDIANALSSLTLDIIGRSAFGTELNAQDARSPSPLLPKIRMLFEGGTNAFTSVLMNFLPERMFEQLRRQKQAVNEIRAVCRQMIEQRVAENKRQPADTPQHDLLGLLVGCKDDKGEGMPMETIINEAMAFLLAGHETTSTLMTWLLYALAINPEVDSKVFKELHQHADKVLTSTPTHQDLRSLPYLLMTIEETCRLYPPIPLLARQARFQDNSLQLTKEQLVVPRGAMVMLNTLGVHRDAKHWDEPLAFRPERFATRHSPSTTPETTAPASSPRATAAETKSPTHASTAATGPRAFAPTLPTVAVPQPVAAAPVAAATKRGKYTWMPFSAGPRHCIGQDFALLELRSLLSQILVRYRFTLMAGHPPVKPKAFSLVVLRPNTRIMMTVHRR